MLPMLSSAGRRRRLRDGRLRAPATSARGLNRREDILQRPPFSTAAMSAPDLRLSTLFDVRRKTVLITGGGGGLGLMMSAAFVQNGAKGE